MDAIEERRRTGSYLLILNLKRNRKIDVESWARSILEKVLYLRGSAMANLSREWSVIGTSGSDITGISMN